MGLTQAAAGEEPVPDRPKRRLIWLGRKRAG
jgi:hypothetical protein